MDHLASHGYIVIATTSEGSLFPSHSNFALDIRQCLTWLEQQDVLAGGWLLGAVDEAKFGVSGHSMGGGASAQRLSRGNCSRTRRIAVRS